MTLQQWCAQPAGSQPWYVQAVMAPYTMLCPFQHGAATDVMGQVVGDTSAYQPPPSAKPPSISLSTDPAAASQPGAVYAGTDATGAAVYATPQSPQENMTDFRAAVDQFMKEQGNRTPPSDPCGHWFSIFDSTCPGGSGWLGAALAIGAVVGGLMLVKGVTR